MPRQNNFLIGQGERLAYQVDVPTGGSPKVPPYDFVAQQGRLTGMLSETYDYIRALPLEACPNERAVAVVTMHPRFIAKSDFPETLLGVVGLRAVGSRTVQIVPEKWGTNRHPEEAATDALFVAGTRTAFSQWAETIQNWSESSRVSESLRTIENVSAFPAETKVRSIPAEGDSVMLEVVLHNAGDELVVQSFFAYASLFSATIYTEKRRDVGGLTFLPVQVARDSALGLASHSFVRVARGMPSLRPLHPGLTRDLTDDRPFPLQFPNGQVIVSDTEAAIFDGGIPDDSRASLAPWVSITEPSGIGPSDPASEDHGLAVTSAFLFGQLSPDRTLERPLVLVNHVRVLDQASGSPDPLNFEYFEIIDRITSHLDQNESRYGFVNLSIGPDIPITDDDVSYWTSALDQRFARFQSVLTVAVGNTGSRDAASGLNRLQPPADAINALSVGATNRLDNPWQRADYSSVGPGRPTGRVKPDGVAFGGSPSQPFNVIGSNNFSRAVCGTSFAAPLCLRASAGTRVQLGTGVSPLAIRALMVHRAEDDDYDRAEVGWGRFELDPDLMITCHDNEPLIIPSAPLRGNVTITATILIAPQVNSGFVASYTESGFEAVFRPHTRQYTVYPGGGQSVHPKSKAFFSESAMYRGAEYDLRGGGLKWEPCVKRARTFQAKTLLEPVFDIYNHSRQAGSRVGTDNPVPYALVVSIKAPRVPDLYDQIVRAYQGVLIPIRPRLRLRVTPQI